MIGRIAATGALALALSAGIAASPASAKSMSEGSSSKGTLTTSAKASADGVAAPYEYRVYNAQCFSNGITFTGQTIENGFSGTQRFRQTAREQQYTTSGWQNITPKYVSNSAKFANTGGSTTYTLNWSFSHPNTGTSYRVLWQGLYLNGAGRVIAKTPQVKVNCF